MALIPDPSWAVPAKTWESVIDRYVHFRRVKAWRGRSRTADGSVNPNRLSREAAVKLKQRLKACVSRLIDEGVLSPRAYPLRQMMVEALLEQLSCRHRDFDRAPAIVQHLWRAAVLNRDCYTCRYCRRTAWRTHRELGATLRFELDHRRAKSRLGTRRDDFKVGNIVIACRSCNVVKGQMTRQHFLKELKSLSAGSEGRTAA